MEEHREGGEEEEEGKRGEEEKGENGGQGEGEGEGEEEKQGCYSPERDQLDEQQLEELRRQQRVHRQQQEEHQKQKLQLQAVRFMIWEWMSLSGYLYLMTDTFFMRFFSSLTCGSIFFPFISHSLVLTFFLATLSEKLLRTLT